MNYIRKKKNTTINRTFKFISGNKGDILAIAKFRVFLSDKSIEFRRTIVSLICSRKHRDPNDIMLKFHNRIFKGPTTGLYKI